MKIAISNQSRKLMNFELIVKYDKTEALNMMV